MRHVGSLLPDQGANSLPPALEGEVLITELPGESPAPVLKVLDSSG